MNRESRTDGHYPGLLLMITAADNRRVGHCWMSGRLLEGDLIMCITHAGDCFWRYQLVEHHAWIGTKGRRGYRLIPASEFGAYTLGKPFKFQPTTREMHLLMAGEMTSLEADTDRP